MPMRGMGAAHVAPDTGNDATRSEMEDERMVRSPKLLPQESMGRQEQVRLHGLGRGVFVDRDPLPTLPVPCK